MYRENEIVPRKYIYLLFIAVKKILSEFFSKIIKPIEKTNGITDELLLKNLFQNL